MKKVIVDVLNRDVLREMIVTLVIIVIQDVGIRLNYMQFLTIRLYHLLILEITLLLSILNKGIYELLYPIQQLIHYVNLILLLLSMLLLLLLLLMGCRDLPLHSAGWRNRIDHFFVRISLLESCIEIELSIIVSSSQGKLFQLVGGGLVIEKIQYFIIRSKGARLLFIEGNHLDYRIGQQALSANATSIAETTPEPLQLAAYLIRLLALFANGPMALILVVNLVVDEIGQHELLLTFKTKVPLYIQFSVQIMVSARIGLSFTVTHVVLAELQLFAGVNFHTFMATHQVMGFIISSIAIQILINCGLLEINFGANYLNQISFFHFKGVVGLLEDYIDL